MERTQAQLDAMRPEDFAGPGQSYPIETQEDVDNATSLLHHASDPSQTKRNIKKIAKKKGLKVPNSWDVNIYSYDSCFSTEFKEVQHEGKAYKVRTGKLFEVGSYADKGIPSVTTEDLDRLVSNFKPIDIGFSEDAGINLEHKSTPLDGHLGKIAKVWREGDALMGDCIVPQFISDVLDETGIKGLSIEVDKNLTNISGLALTKNPRVVTAALFSDDEELKEIVAQLFSTKKEESKVADEKTVTMSQEQVDLLKSQADKSAELEIKFSKLEAEMKTKEAEITFSNLVKAGKVVPAQKEAAIALMTADDNGTVKFSTGDVSISAAVKALLENAPVAIDFSAKGEEADPNKQAAKFSTFAEFSDLSSEDKAEAIRSYMSEHKITSFFDARNKLVEEISNAG